MEVKPTNVNGVARLYQKTVNSQPKKNDSSRVSRQDVVEISREGANRSVFESTVRSIAAEVSKDVPTEKLNKLSRKVESGEYFVSAQDIARAILTKTNYRNGE